MLTRWSSGILRRLQRHSISPSSTFVAGDACMVGIEVDRNHLSMNTQQRKKSFESPLVKQESVHVFMEILLVDQVSAADSNFSVQAKVSSLTEVPWLAGIFELVERLWRQLTFSASEQMWRRFRRGTKSWLLPDKIYGAYKSSLFSFLYVSVTFFPASEAVLWRLFSSTGLNIESEASSSWSFLLRTYVNNSSSRVSVAFLDWYSSDATSEFAILGQTLSAVVVRLNVASSFDESNLPG